MKPNHSPFICRSYKNHSYPSYLHHFHLTTLSNLPTTHQHIMHYNHLLNVAALLATLTIATPVPGQFIHTAKIYYTDKKQELPMSPRTWQSVSATATRQTFTQTACGPFQNAVTWQSVYVPATRQPSSQAASGLLKNEMISPISSPISASSKAESVLLYLNLTPFHLVIILTQTLPLRPSKPSTQPTQQTLLSPSPVKW